MHQFLTGSDADYRSLENKAQGKCIRFKNQEMPSMAIPSKAHIGFEVDNKTDRAIFWVSKGILYEGSNSVKKWFQHGKKEFQNFDALKRWIRTELASAFGILATSGNRTESGNGPVQNGETQELTDMNAVRRQLPEQTRGIYFNESDLFDGLGKYVKGQVVAMQALSQVIVRHCARKSPSRPAVLFAIGPSGVGKTRSAESLIKVITDLSPDNTGYQFLRIDMSEYQEAHRVSQLIGAPQGYVGHGEGSQLTDALRSNPRTLILFDEIEKAHPSIMRVLMNAMDAGRLSTASRSGSGHEIDCSYAIFFFTSNIDANAIIDELMSRNAFTERTVIDEVCRRRLKASEIAPEIIGRIGRFLVYRQLSQTDRAEIMTLSIAEVAAEYGLTVSHIMPEVIVAFMQKSGNDDFGARPEKYFIDDELGGYFAKAAMEGQNNICITGPPYKCESALVRENASMCHNNEEKDDDGNI